MANELYDGTRVFTAAAGATAQSADQNQQQDLLILGLQARVYDIPLTDGVSVANWTLVYNTASTPPAEWQESTHVASSHLLIPLKLRAGEYVTLAEAWIKGDAAMTGGSIKVLRTKHDATAGVSTVADATNGDANPWQYAATKAHSSAALTHQVDGDYHYWMDFENATAGPIADTWIYGARITTRFHFGA